MRMPMPLKRLWRRRGHVLDDAQKKLCENLVYEMCSRGEYADTFTELSRHIELPHQMEGRYIFSWKCEPGGKVSTSGELMPQKEAFFTDMEEYYPGIYTASVFLFPDESISLKLNWEKEGEQHRSMDLSISGGGVYSRDGSVFSGIVSEITVRKEHNDEEFLRQIAQDERRRRVTAELFALI